MTEMPANEPLSGPFQPTTHDQWLDLVTQSLKGADFEKRLVAKTRDGIRIAPLHQQAADAAPIRAGRIASPWAIAQRIDHPAPKIANELALADLEQGAAALILAFPEAAAARGFGLDAGTVADLDVALANVSLDMISLRVEPGPRQAERAELVAALVAERGIAAADVSIVFGLDPLAAAMSAGGLPAAWADVSRDFAATVTELRAKGFGGALVSCDTRPVHEAGGTEAQELAAALAMGVAYLKALGDAGMPLAEATGLLSWTIAIDADQF
ncbi:MAG: methylmalonyl-CoA mutase, partial [Hyphomicrobiaceae bacterium]|nr:methylmalonyl-CoA mutase [Hyphomicrobiaceae bacterium]